MEKKQVIIKKFLELQSKHSILYSSPFPFAAASSSGGLTVIPRTLRKLKLKDVFIVFTYFLNYTNVISKDETHSVTLVSFFGCGATQKKSKLYQDTEV